MSWQYSLLRKSVRGAIFRSRNQLTHMSCNSVNDVKSIDDFRNYSVSELIDCWKDARAQQFLSNCVLEVASVHLLFIYGGCGSHYLIEPMLFLESFTHGVWAVSTIFCTCYIGVDLPCVRHVTSTNSILRIMMLYCVNTALLTSMCSIACLVAVRNF